MEIKKVGIVGAGQMGKGIAHVIALAGYDVMINDASSDALKDVLVSIERNMSRQVKKAIITSDAQTSALAKISKIGRAHV